MKLTEVIKDKGFVITCEISSPKGVNIDELLDRSDIVREVADLINVGDNQRAVMRAASWAICRILKSRGLEPVMEICGRDRNRLAVQSDILGAALLGIENLLLSTGYDPSVGDHAQAKAVYDLDATALVAAARSLTEGKDITGHALNEAPDLCYGIMATPGLDADGENLTALKAQLDAGACFIQTQPVYELGVLDQFLDAVRGYDVPVIVGHVILKSASMASFMNSNVPGVRVPDSMIRELEGLPRQQVAEVSLQLSGELLKQFRGRCQGIHIMAEGWERFVPRLVQAALA